MVFIACGLNYKTAPIAIREQIAVIAEHDNLYRLAETDLVEEIMVLSTCNRTEIYCITANPHAILPALARDYNLDLALITPHFYLYEKDAAIRHALAVASGLDSMMIGETQIFGQMKNALQKAQASGTVRSVLQQIFAFIFRSSKKIRTESGIGRNAISVASAGATLINELFTDSDPLNILITGTGETASLIAKHLATRGICNFIVAGRNPENTRRLADTLNGTAIAITDLDENLAYADVLISATSCPLPFISAKMISRALNERRHKPMCLLDLAVPRDIETNVGELAAVHLYNIDDLNLIAERGLQERQKSALIASDMITAEIHTWHRLRNMLKAREVICDYRNHMQDLAHMELDRARQKLKNGDCQYEVLAEFSERLVNKLTHAPTVALKRAASDNHQELLDWANIFKAEDFTLQ